MPTIAVSASMTSEERAMNPGVGIRKVKTSEQMRPTGTRQERDPGGKKT